MMTKLPNPSRWAIGVFTVVFILSMTLVDAVNSFYAEKSLRSDANLLLYQFHDALTQTHEVLAALPAPATIQCDEKFTAYLSDTVYRHPTIRLLGVLDHGKMNCASQPVHIDMNKHHDRLLSKADQVVTDNFLLSAIGDKGELDLLMIREHNGISYFASINPFMVDYLAEFACMSCLEYDFIVEGMPRLEFNSRTMDKPSVIEHFTNRQEGELNISLHVRATQEFFNYYQDISWWVTFALSLLVAGAAAFVAHYLASKRQSFQKMLEEAIGFDEFVPFYQPIVNSQTGVVIGVEMLARWVKENGTVVPPDQFIPYAEENGLIIEISEQLIKKSAQDMATLGWGKTGQFASINIVPEHLSDHRLYRFIEAQVEKHHLPHSIFSLEITERKKIEDLEKARRALNQFYRAAIPLKLDDAGTGYGGFSYIQELGVQTLKIDKMFIDTINKTDFKSSVLKPIIAFAQTSNLGIIAEGVERKDQVDFLAELNVFNIQGYFYAKPMPIAELSDWLKQQSSLTFPVPSTSSSDSLPELACVG